MKLAFLFSPYILPRPINFNCSWTDPRGTSGTDLAALRITEILASQNHDISLFIAHIGDNQPKIWNGVKLFNYNLKNTMIDETYDAAISLSCPDDFRGLPLNILRMCLMTLNGFSYCQNGFDQYVDLYSACSQKHLDYELTWNMTDPTKWKVLSLGCDPKLYNNSNKVKSRLLFASSADRGLFHLLSIYPEIKKAIPDLSLNICYNFQYGETENYEKGIAQNESCNKEIFEIAQRIRYMKNTIPRLEHLGVKNIGSASQEQMIQEFNECSVFPYPCHNISAFCEGFSCSLLQACISKSCPITSKADALEEIYGKHIPTFNIPKDLDQFKNTVIKALTDEKYRNDINEKAYQLASQYTWQQTAKNLEQMIISHPKFGNKEKVADPIDESSLIKLNISCGTNFFPYDGWINYDYEDMTGYLDAICGFEDVSAMPQHQRNVVDYLKKQGNFRFKKHDINQGFPEYKDNSVDLIAFLQTIEHLNPIFQIPNILKEFHRMLKPGGLIRITTPDLDLLINKYLNNQMDEFNDEQPEYYKNTDQGSKLAYIMYGSGGPNSTRTNYEGHMFLFTKASMTTFLNNAGFSEIYFYTENRKSKSLVMASECVDFGVSHSIIVEAVK